MHRNIKYRNFILLSFAILTLFSCALSTTDNNNFVDAEFSSPNSNFISIYELNIDSSSVKNLYEKFPYENFIGLIDYTNIGYIDSNLIELNAITSNRFVAENILTKVLTSSLEKVLQTDNFDSLYMILNWADKFKCYSSNHLNNYVFYNAISEYWYQYVAKVMHNKSIVNSANRYTFKYRYLAQKAYEVKVYTNEEVSLTDKAIFYVFEKKWAYILNRFWNDTDFYFKVIAIIICIMFIVPYFFGIKKIFKLIFKKHINENK